MPPKSYFIESLFSVRYRQEKESIALKEKKVSGLVNEFRAAHISQGYLIPEMSSTS